MKKSTILLSSIIALAFSGCATNTNNLYLGGGLSTMSTGTTNNFFEEKNGQDRTGAVTVVGGYEVNKNVDIEARFTKSFTNHDFLKHTTWGIYAKPKYEVYNNLNVYGLLGLGGVKVSQNKNSGVKFTDTNLHLGLGASYDVNEKITLFADYVNMSRDKKVSNYLGSEKKVDTAAATLGLIYNF